MMVFLHLYMQYTQPLFVQAVMAFKTLYDSKVFKIHVLGQPAEGDLKRPFKVASLFGGAFIYALSCRLYELTDIVL